MKSEKANLGAAAETTAQGSTVSGRSNPQKSIVQPGRESQGPMNFHGDLRFEGDILRWAKKEKGGVDLLFDCGEETSLFFSDDCAKAVLSALTKVMMGGEDIDKKESTGKGRIIPHCVVVDLEDKRVTIRGQSAIDSDDMPMPSLLLESMDKKSSIDFWFNEGQATELATRLLKIAQARQALRTAMQKKTVPVTVGR